MRTVRFTVGGLMAIVLFLALAMAAMRRASPLCSSAVFTATLAVLSTMSLLAVERTGARRVTWCGASLFG